MSFKSYRQLENSDCGITCIRMIAKFYGKAIPLKYLRTIVETTKLGITPQDIVAGFNKINMTATAVALHPKDIYHMPYPAVLFWNDNHYVVLYKIDLKKNLFHIADPAIGKIIFRNDEFFKYWLGNKEKGIVILAEPSNKFKKFSIPNNEKGHGLYQLIKNELHRYRSSFSKVIFLSLLCIAADLVSPILLQKTVDDGIKQHDIHLVWLLILFQFAFFLGNMISSGLMQLQIVNVGLKINMDMISNYLSKLINLPLSFFDRKSASDLIQKVDDQIRIKEFLLSIPQSYLSIAFNLIAFSALLIWYNYILFLIFLFFTICEVGWAYIFVMPLRRIDYVLFSHLAENRNIIYELLNGIIEIKTNNSQLPKLKKWKDNQTIINTFSKKTTFIGLILSNGQSIIARIKELTITGICATLVIKGYLTLGAMLTIGYLVGRLSSPFNSIITNIRSIQMASISYERLDEVINSSCSKNEFPLQNFNHCLELKNIRFRYYGSTSPFVISELSAKIIKGTSTAIVGESGCGKSTLMKLMLGFYIPQEGEIYIDGKNIASAKTNSWISHCGVVMQNGYIFSDTISANISLSDEFPNIDKVRECATIAGISEFIESLPIKYNTKIGATGIELSGGQKQRILIARALYKNPDVLFLDEATSSLDAKNENEITHRIFERFKDRTVVIAAHRLSTIKNADVILFMRDGKIVERGSHDHLISLKGEYYELVNKQLEYTDSSL